MEQLYRDMAPTLRAYFRRQFVAGTNADDLLQDTFLRALRGIDRVRASISPRAYLFGIARHVWLDAVRHGRIATEPLTDETAALAPEARDPRLEDLRIAIAELPPVHREPLLLKLQHELSYAEIAEVLGVPLGTVRSRLHHAVRRLQSVLNPDATIPSPHEQRNT